MFNTTLSIWAFGVVWINECNGVGCEYFGDFNENRYVFKWFKYGESFLI